MTKLHLAAATLLAAAFIAAPAHAQTTARNTTLVAEMTPATAPAPEPRPSAAIPDIPAPVHATALPDPDANIVTYVPSAPNELPIGTLLKARMNETVSTKNTLTGTPFTAEVEDPIMRDGKVIIPAGATLRGTVTDIHGGARLFGRASLVLTPDSVLLPDGTHYILHARTIDTDMYRTTQIAQNGSIITKDHTKQEAGILTLTAGSGAAAGAVFGGVPGALIGAGVGAGVSTAHWLRQDRQTIVPAETHVVFSLTTSMPMIPLH